MGLYQNMQVDPVRQLAMREPVTAGPETSLREAVGLMREKQLGCVIVLDESQRPAGIFTESMLTQLLAENPAVLDEPLKDHVAQRWPWVKLSDKVADVLEAMQTKNVRFLGVVDDDGRLVGLTGQKGLMEYVAEFFPGQVMVQRIGGKPYTEEREGA